MKGMRTWFCTKQTKNTHIVQRLRLKHGRGKGAPHHHRRRRCSIDVESARRRHRVRDRYIATKITRITVHFGTLHLTMAKDSARRDAPPGHLSHSLDVVPSVTIKVFFCLFVEVRRSVMKHGGKRKNTWASMWLRDAHCVSVLHTSSFRSAESRAIRSRT